MHIATVTRARYSLEEVIIIKVPLRCLCLGFFKSEEGKEKQATGILTSGLTKVEKSLHSVKLLTMWPYLVGGDTCRRHI